MAPPTFACAGERAPRCSLVRCPSHQGPKTPGHPGAPAHTVLPQGRCLGSRGFGLGSPLVPSSSHACPGPSTGVGGLTAVRPCARLFDTALPAPSTLPTVRSTTSGHRTAGSQARRLRHLRASRSPSRQIGGRLLRCRHSRYPGASADSLTRHATPAVSSCCTTLPPHHWSLGPSRYAFCRSAIPRFTHSPTGRGPAAAAQHSPGRVLSLSLRQ